MMKYLKIDQVAITPDLLPLKKFFTRPIGFSSLLRKSPERLKKNLVPLEEWPCVILYQIKAYKHASGMK